MATTEKTTKKPSDGVLRRGDAQKPGVLVEKYFVYRVTEYEAEDPGIEKDRNGKPRAHCGKTGVQGYVVNVRENKSRFTDKKTAQDGEEATFKMLEFFLTAPAYGVSEGEGGQGEATVLLQPGSLLLVPGNHALTPLFPYGAHPTQTIEVAIYPGNKSQKATQSGFYPREWEIRRISDAAVQRSAIAGLAVLPALSPAPEAQLAALPERGTES
jgi:hypothetical protein